MPICCLFVFFIRVNQLELATPYHWVENHNHLTARCHAVCESRILILVDGSTYSPSRLLCSRSGECCRSDRSVSGRCRYCRRCRLWNRWCWSWQRGFYAGRWLDASSISLFSICVTARSPCWRSHGWKQTVDGVNGWTAFPTRPTPPREVTWRLCDTRSLLKMKNEKNILLSLWHSDGD